VLSHADVPTVVPGILAGPVPPGGDAQSFPADGLSGAPIAAFASQHVGSLPVLGGQGLLVDFETLARLGGPLADNGRLSVWLKDPADAARVTAALAAQGIAVTDRHTYAAARDRLDESASAWSLRLAAFVGVMAAVLAAIVVVVMSVTGWRVVARDLAALRMAGVPVSALRRSLLREQVIVVLGGAVVGALCGTLSSVVAMPLVPLFDSDAAPVPALDLAPSAPAVVGAAVAAALAIALVGVVAALATGRRIELRRVREAL
jgi:ABC-type lipoprotein release transport system permease subunit